MITTDTIDEDELLRREVRADRERRKAEQDDADENEEVQRKRLDRQREIEREQRIAERKRLLALDQEIQAEAKPRLVDERLINDVVGHINAVRELGRQREQIASELGELARQSAEAQGKPPPEPVFVMGDRPEAQYVKAYARLLCQRLNEAVPGLAMQSA